MTEDERLAELLDAFKETMDYASVAIVPIERFDAFATKHGFSEATAQRLRQEIAAKTTAGKAPVYAVIDYSHEKFGVVSVEEQAGEAFIAGISAASVTLMSDLEDEIDCFNEVVPKAERIKLPFSMRGPFRSSGAKTELGAVCPKAAHDAPQQRQTGGKRNYYAEYVRLGEKLQAGTAMQQEFYKDHKNFFDMCDRLDKNHKGIE